LADNSLAIILLSILFPIINNQITIDNVLMCLTLGFKTLFIEKEKINDLTKKKLNKIIINVFA